MRYCDCLVREKLYLQSGCSQKLFVCSTCNKMVSVQTLQLPDEIMKPLLLWQNDYGNWFDDQSGVIFHGGEHLIEIHHAQGSQYSRLLKETYHYNVEYVFT